MDIKNKKKYQSSWDSILIRGFMRNEKLYWCVCEFLKKHTDPESLKGMDSLGKTKAISSFDLKRCFSRVYQNGVKDLWLPSTVRYHVGQCSPSLAGALLNKENCPLDVLLIIRKFKWKLNSKASNERNNETQKQKRFVECTKFEKQREKSANWNQTK